MNGIELGRRWLEVPILQGGMGVGVSLGRLAGAVAACGGMGTVSTAVPGFDEPDFARDPQGANLRALRREVRRAREIAGKSGLVAVNAMVATTQYADSVRAAIEAGVDAIVSGAGLPLAPSRCVDCLRPCGRSTAPYCIARALIRAVRGVYENGLFFCGAGVHRLEGMHSVAWLMKHWKTEWRAFA